MAFKNDVANDMAPIGHFVWPCRAPRLAPYWASCLVCGVLHQAQAPLGTSWASCRAFRSAFYSSLPPPFTLPPDILIFSRRFCHPLSRPLLDQSRPAPSSGTIIWSHRFGKHSSCLPSDLPCPAPFRVPSFRVVDLISLQFLSCWIDAHSGLRWARCPKPI